MGLSREAVRQIELKAFARLAKRLDRRTTVDELRWVEQMRGLSQAAHEW